MKTEIFEIQNTSEELNYAVKIHGKTIALFRSLEDAKYYLDAVLQDHPPEEALDDDLIQENGILLDA